MAVDVSAIKDRLTERYTAAHAAAVADIVDALKDAAPKGEFRDSGGPSLVDTISAGPTTGGPVLVTEIRADAEHASYTNSGTQPHIIVPVQAHALAFQVGGQNVFVKRVFHPGTEGTHWFDDTLREASGTAIEHALGR